MSTIERPRKDGTSGWQVIIRPPGGKTIVKTFDDKETANLFERMIDHEMKTTRLRKALAARAPKDSKQFAMEQREPAEKGLAVDARELYDAEPLRQTLKLYIGAPECPPKTRAVVPSVLKTAGDVCLGQLKKRWVRQYIEHLRNVPTQLGDPYAYSTIQGYLSVINCATRWRAEELDLEPTRLPFNKRNMFPRDYCNQRSRRLDRDEEVALFATLRDMHGSSNRHYRLLTRLALETGARLQEMVLAEWSEFDLDKAAWSIPAKHVKTGVGRFMPLPRRALKTMRLLERMRDASKPQVFHLLGKPASVSSVFARIVSKANIADFHFHDLRHEAISRLVLKQRGFSVDMVMTMVGHSSLSMLRRYTNLRPEELVARLM
jgi:integrase